MHPSLSRKLFALSFGFGAVILATQMAQAQAQCAPREEVTAHLADRYGETRRAMGIAGPDAVMELYASDTTGTWTITITLADGQMCMMASGQGFEALADPLPAKGEKI
ncbi:MAG: hypothetical protein HC783_10550 [Rhodobacteraceae bacterium]|nr:hypothetical protein [Paracoccaceae bacterium]